MATTEPIPLPDLPTAGFSRVLTDFIDAAQTAFADDLRARSSFRQRGRRPAARHLRCQSLSSSFAASTSSRGDLRDPLRVAQAAIRLSPDVHARSGIAVGDYSLCGKILRHPPPAQSLVRTGPVCRREDSPRDFIARLDQVLLNLILRLARSLCHARTARRTVRSGHRRSCGPLRSCAATLLELEGQPAARQSSSGKVRQNSGNAWLEALPAHLRSARATYSAHRRRRNEPIEIDRDRSASRTSLSKWT